MKTADDKHFSSTLTGLQQPSVATGSALNRYRSMAVGRQGYAALLLYELVVTCVLPLPGNTGRWARRLFLRRLCRSFGREIGIGRDCTVRNPGVIEIGDRAEIGDQVSLDAKPDVDGLRIGADVRIGDGTICNCAGATLDIGEGTEIGAACRVGSKLGLTVGRNCRIGQAVCISGAAHAYDRRDPPIVLQPVTCKGPTVIGDEVVIGDRATILDGVRIGSGVRIAADSLVISDIPAGITVSGVPVRISEGGR